MITYRQSFLVKYLQKRVFTWVWIWSIMGGIGLISACSSQPQSIQTPNPQANPLRTLEGRVTAMENNQAKLLRELQSEIKGLKQNLQELEQLKQNQNILLLDLQGKFDERLAQIEQELTRNKLNLRKQSGEFARMQKNMRDMRITLDQGDFQQPLQQQATQPLKSEATETPSQSLAEASSLSSELPQSTPGTSEPSSSDVDQLFETGWDLHKNREYSKALEVFQEFRKTYPQHPNAIEAHYLIGDSYYSLQDYQNAAIEFFDFIEQNPQYPSTSDAQWKLAQSLEKSGETGLALDIYQELAQGSSPYREEAQKSLELYEKK